jgi:hypothetical protein
VHGNLYLPQLLTPITLSVVAAVCARSHHQASDTDDTFVLPKFVGYLMIACGIVFCATPFLPRTRGGDLSAAKFYLICAPIWGGAFLAAAYFFRCRVVITANTLTVGAFRRKAISFEDVVDYDVLSGRYSPELIVYLRTGKNCTLSGMLPDFDELVGLINSHMAIPPRGSETGSPAKLLDRSCRARGASDVPVRASEPRSGPSEPCYGLWRCDSRRSCARVVIR